MMVTVISTLLRPYSLSSRSRQRGVTAIEYALIASLIAVAIVGAVGSVGEAVSEKWNTVATQVSTATAN